MRWASHWVVAVGFILLGFAGCLGGSPEASVGPAEPIEVEPGLFVEPGKGAIRGIVYNEASIGLRGVHVSLPDLDRFVSTDAQGRFLFLNVTPGAIRLLAFLTGFEGYEGRANVTAHNVTNADVFLLPVDGRGAGYVPHLHDYWGDKTEYVMMDADVPIEPSMARHGNVNDTPHANSAWRMRAPAGTPDKPSIILPGTKEVRVKITWTSSSTTLEAMGFQYRPPNANVSTPVTLPPRPSGQGWTFAIEPWMTDSGHQVSTNWQFWLCPCNDVRYAPNYRPAVFNGPVHVQIILVKGQVVLEAEHPDFWKGQSFLSLRPGGQYVSPININVNERQPSAHCLYLPGATLVPPGTARMRLEFQWRYNTANGTALDRNYVLTWRTNQHDAGAPLSEYRRMPPKERGDHRVVYELDVPPADADPFYNKRSNWCWLPGVEGFENEERTLDVGRGPSFALAVHVWRDAAFQ